MSRSNFGIPEHYVIVGKTSDGVEHFIASSCGAGWLKMFLRTIRYKFTYRYRDRYDDIYFKKLYD